MGMASFLFMRSLLTYASFDSSLWIFVKMELKYRRRTISREAAARKCICAPLEELSFNGCRLLNSPFRSPFEERGGGGGQLGLGLRAL